MIVEHWYLCGNLTRTVNFTQYYNEIVLQGHGTKVREEQIKILEKKTTMKSIQLHRMQIKPRDTYLDDGHRSEIKYRE